MAPSASYRANRSDDSVGLVIIVDDNPLNRRVLYSCLREDGHKILVAEDGEDLLEQLEFVEPDLILLDVVMPGIDGYEVCRRIKADPRRSEIPIILITALSESGDKMKGYAAGAVDYVTKPIVKGEIMARVKTHIALRSLQRERGDREAPSRRGTAGRGVGGEQLLAGALRDEVRPPLRLMVDTLEARYSREKDGSAGAGDSHGSGPLVAAAHGVLDAIDDLILMSAVSTQMFELAPVCMADVVPALLEERAHVQRQDGPSEIVVPDPWPTALAYRPWVERLWRYLLDWGWDRAAGRRLTIACERLHGGFLRMCVRPSTLGAGAEADGSEPLTLPALDSAENARHRPSEMVAARILNRLGGEIGGRGDAEKFFTLLEATTTRR